MQRLVNMKIKYFIISGILLSLLVVTVLALSIVPVPKEKDCLVAKGIVTSVAEGGDKDIVFSLKGHSQRFYINRGLEQGLSITTLEQQLKGQEVVIKYPDYTAVLDPAGSVKHITKMYYKGGVLFSEID